MAHLAFSQQPALVQALLRERHAAGNATQSHLVIDKLAKCPFVADSRISTHEYLATVLIIMCKIRDCESVITGLRQTQALNIRICLSFTSDQVYPLNDNT